MSTPPDINRINLLDCITPECVSASLADVRSNPTQFPTNEMAWLEQQDAFWALQVTGFYAGSIAKIGPENGKAALVGVLFSNRILREMTTQSTLDYGVVKGIRSANFPYKARARTQMDWNPDHPADYDSREDAEKELTVDVVDAIWNIRHPTTRTACVAGLIVSLLDTRGRLPMFLSFGR